MLLLLGVVCLAVAAAGMAVHAASLLGLRAIVLREYGGAGWSIEEEIEELASAATLAPAQIAARAMRELFTAARACESQAAAARIIDTHFEGLISRARRRERRLSIARWTPAIALSALLLAFVGLIVGGISPGRLSGLAGVGFLSMVLAAVACVPAAWAGATQPRGAARLVLRHALVLEAVRAARAGETIGVTRTRLLMLAFPERMTERADGDLARAQAA